MSSLVAETNAGLARVSGAAERAARARLAGPSALLLSSEFPPGPGGIGNHAYHLAVHLERLDWRLVVLSPQDHAGEAEIAEFTARTPLKVHRVPSCRGRLREACRRFRVGTGLLREHRPELLVATGLSGVWVGAALSAAYRLPLAAVAHGTEFGVCRGLTRAINAWAFRQANVVIPVSEFTRRLLAPAGIQPRSIEVITNAADAAVFPVLPTEERRRFRERAGFPTEPLLLTVGQVSPRKGQEVVIRALPKILERVPEAHYLMIGLPTRQSELNQLARELGVADRVHFLGKLARSELVQWLNACDVFLMTSRTTQDGDCEGFGIAVVEAALCGKPAVVSNASGVVEAIQDEVTGLAVPEDNPVATAQAVVTLLSDPARLKAMGMAARNRALREQVWEISGQKFHAVLSRLLRPT